ncbi:SLC13 family permease [Desulfobulbus alkaliphilus]|uniref:SLC13 family permease n=1 Tax=Desulfobulbus alkaliphilus TaxID=869814 RepID=UPI001965BA3E|nr:SLC13 family permease [Desulfobulbus alkaliphilus]MBM9536516.1 anion permease [Desulfobulbus alkaliphilus]
MHAWVASLTFLAVILLVISNRLSPAVAALTGVLVLVYGGIFTLSEAVEQMTSAYSTLALLLGAMIVARTLQPIGIFNKVARRMLIVSRGRGSRLLIGITLVTVMLSAILPNATVVLILGPVLLPLARELKLQPAPLLILVALAANSGGLLTMVGDPATYLISQAAGMHFSAYLKAFSWTGVVAVAVLVLLLPWCWRHEWRVRLPVQAESLPPKVLIPWRFFLPIVAIGSGMLIFFVIGELLEVPVSPDLIALSAASGALILAERFSLDSAADILRDIDWSTLIFFSCTFMLTGALEATGVIEAIAAYLGNAVTTQPQVAVYLLFLAIMTISWVVPNIPIMAALIPLIEALGRQGNRMELYASLLLGGSLGGNATMVGASANMVAVGIARQNGTPILFVPFLHYGLPVCLAQMLVIGLLRLLIGT